VNLVGALSIGSVTFAGIAVTGAPLVAALHHALQHRSLTEVVQVKDLALEGGKALGMGTDT